MQERERAGDWPAKGPVTSLGTREQEVLDSITDRLAGSGPELAALLTAFTLGELR